MFDISNNIKLFAFDLDGTLYLGENLIDGAIDLISFLKKKYKVVFFTNNSTKKRKEIHFKLKKMGFDCYLNEIFTSSYATAKYLDESNIGNVFVIGSDGLRSEVLDKGICIVDNDTAENLVVGLDLDFSYKKIETAMSVLLNNGKFIACNEDRFFPVGGNRYMPACGAMVGAIATASNKDPDFVVGKPNTYILSNIEEAYGIEHHEIVVVGDSYESDILMAKNNNSKAILVNSENNISKRNVLVMESPNKILQYLKNIK
jgi:HAD superfamily hydrolase (TIGR01450 family)|tara:strand:- start:834 stop:1610 length:777 start_codon:yes stop_codon:yes gene_type:complete